MIENQHFHSSTVSQYSATTTQPQETRTHTEAMKARQKCQVAGPTTGCCPNQASCIEEKQIEATSHKPYSEKQTKKTKQKKLAC
jgi:hypothetical protein